MKRGFEKKERNHLTTLDALKTFAYALKKTVFCAGDNVRVKNSEARNVLENKIIENILYGRPRSYFNKRYQDVAILCIGSDYVDMKGDHLGPIVGSKLEEKDSIKGVHIYGTMKDPIYGDRVGKEVESIRKKHPSAYLIIVRSGISYYKNKMGRIYVGKERTKFDFKTGGFCPSIAELEVCPAVIHSEVRDTQQDLLKKIRDVDYNKLNNLAEITADGIHKALKNIREA